VLAGLCKRKESIVELSPEWEFVADTVMGGVSTGQVRAMQVAGRDATWLTGRVSLENDGGFVQMAADLGGVDGGLDADAFSGVEIDVIGNGHSYDLRLRTTDLARPWQSYRVAFSTTDTWRTLRFLFSDFAQNKTDVPFDAARLRRIGILAIGAEMEADVAVAGLRLYA
jgi:hypothetical protein